MKELELTSNAALTDVVYEAALNGSLLNVKLVTGAVGDDEIRGLIPEANHYHVTHPKTSEEILFEQPLDASDNKVPVYGLGRNRLSSEPERNIYTVSSFSCWALTRNTPLRIRVITKSPKYTTATMWTVIILPWMTAASGFQNWRRKISMSFIFPLPISFQRVSPCLSEDDTNSLDGLQKRLPAILSRMIMTASFV